MKISEQETRTLVNICNYFLEPKKGHGALLPSDVIPLRDRLLKTKRRKVTHFLSADFIKSDSGREYQLTSCKRWYSPEFTWQTAEYTQNKSLTTCIKCCKKLGIPVNVLPKRRIQERMSKRESLRLITIDL